MKDGEMIEVGQSGCDFRYRLWWEDQVTCVRRSQGIEERDACSCGIDWSQQPSLGWR